jgi:hypothetical protein
LCKTESFAWAGNKRERTQSLGIGDTLRWTKNSRVYTAKFAALEPYHITRPNDPTSTNVLYRSLGALLRTTHCQPQCTPNLFIHPPWSPGWVFTSVLSKRSGFITSGSSSWMQDDVSELYSPIGTLKSRFCSSVSLKPIWKLWNIIQKLVNSLVALKTTCYTR